MTHRQVNTRRRRNSQRQPLLEFLAMTFLVVAVAFTAGVMVRKGHLDRGTPGEAVGLMKVDRAAREVAEVTPRHQLVPAAAPDVIVEPPAAPAAQPAPVEPATATPAAAPAPAPAPAKPAAAVAPRAPKPAGPTFNGRPLKKVKTIRMLVTAYSPDERSCGASADGITASGYSVWTNGMKMVAADKKLLPFGAVISVPGYNGGQPVPVLDRGGAIKGKRLDVLYPTHEVARKWGKQWLDVTVWAYAD